MGDSLNFQDVVKKSIIHLEAFRKYFIYRYIDRASRFIRNRYVHLLYLS
jgi:hypothetical protein